MKVLFLSDCPYTPNSLGKITYYITRGLLEKGIQVYNVCLATTVTLWEPALTYVDPATGLEMVTMPWPGSLKPLVETYRPDVVLAFGTPYAPPLHEALSECPSIEAPCAGYFDNESLHVIPGYALYAANAVAFAAPTEFARRTLADGLAKGGVPREIVEERTMTVHHGVDVDLYKRAAREAEPLFPDDTFTYTTFSKNHIRKNIAALLEAYAMLGQEAIDKTRLFLALVGFGGDSRWDTRLLIEYMETLHGVSITDRVYELVDHERRTGITEEQVLRIYRSTTVFVFPSEGEAFGLPPVEAALFGRPVIVTTHPALVEIWGELPRQCLVPAKPYVLPEAFGLVKPDPHALSAAMRALLEDARLYRRAAAKARRIAEQYTWQRMVEGIEKLLELASEPGLKPMNRYMKTD